jgi:hypothetical protein
MLVMIHVGITTPLLSEWLSKMLRRGAPRHGRLGQGLYNRFLSKVKEGLLQLSF